MKPIPDTFFITGLGRSGTRFLAEVLGRSRTHRVIHEWQLGWVHRDSSLRRFPIERFWLARHPFPGLRRGYGEVNSYLRRHIGDEVAGPERWVERRGIVFRDPRDVIASAMNRAGQTETDFDAVCARILTDYAHLRRAAANPALGYEAFSFHLITTDLDALASLSRWAGVLDVDLSSVDLNKKVNANPDVWFPRWQDWAARHQETYLRLEESLVPRAWRQV